MKLLHIIAFTLFLFLASCTATDEKNNTGESERTESEASRINQKVVAYLDNLEITNGDFKNHLRAKYSDLKSVFNKNNLISRLFDSFIEDSILLKSSENETIPITDEEISEYCGKNQVNLNETTKKSIGDIIRIEKYLYKKIYNNISVSKYEIQKYFNQNRKDFSSKQRVELYQILTGNREEAIKIRGELLNNPSAFESLARDKSISQESVKDGYMGEFEKGDLPKELESVVNNLPVNQISRVVESQFGFHIFKVSKRIRGRQRYLKDVSEDIEKILFNKKMMYEYSRYMKILKKNIKVTINYDNLFFTYQELKGD